MVIAEMMKRFEETHKRPQFKRITNGSRVLVFAPHPDDEIIGPGGTLLKHLSVGNSVHIVFVTDGRKGRSRKQSCDEIIAIRMNEAIHVCKELGADYTFLGCEDGNYIPEETKMDYVREMLNEVNPTDIFIPHIHDSHRDHFMTNLLFCQSVWGGEGEDRTIWEYEVWAPLVPNTVINISEEFSQKSELLAIYQSQLQLIGYQEIMEGLNKYRVSTIPMKGITYIEAFYCSKENEYKEKMKRVFNDR